MLKLAIGLLAGILLALALLGGPDPEILVDRASQAVDRASQLSGWAPGGIDSLGLEVHEALCKPGQLAICK